MIKIIKEGTKPVTYLELNCKNCHCRALVSIDETKEVIRGGFAEMMHRTYTEYETKCPCCGFYFSGSNLVTMDEPIGIKRGEEV